MQMRGETENGVEEKDVPRSSHNKRQPKSDTYCSERKSKQALTSAQYLSKVLDFSVFIGAPLRV